MIQIVGTGAPFEELYYVSSEKFRPFRGSFCIPISGRVALLVFSRPNSRDKNAPELSQMERGGAPNGERCGRHSPHVRFPTWKAFSIRFPKRATIDL